jgi:hypothetical protein
LKLDLEPGEELANRTFNFHSAKLPQVLGIYQGVAGRTVIRSLTMVENRFDLKSGSALAGPAATAMLVHALSEKGMVLKLRGDKFALLVSAAQEQLLSAIPDPPTPVSIVANPAASETKWGDEALPPGMVKFEQSDILQVLDIYGAVTGRTILRPDRVSGRVSVISQTLLTRKEMVWLLDTLLYMAGIAMVPESDKFVFALPTLASNKVSKFNPQTALAKSRKTSPPKVMRLQEADVAELLEAYAALLGREPLPLGPKVSPVKFFLRSPTELSQAEAIFALEAVAGLNNLKLELVGEDQVQIMPAGQGMPNKPVAF